MASPFSVSPDRVRSGPGPVPGELDGVGQQVDAGPGAAWSGRRGQRAGRQSEFDLALFLLASQLGENGFGQRGQVDRARAPSAAGSSARRPAGRRSTGPLLPVLARMTPSRRRPSLSQLAARTLRARCARSRRWPAAAPAGRAKPNRRRPPVPCWRPRAGPCAVAPVVPVLRSAAGFPLRRGCVR